MSTTKGTQHLAGEIRSASDLDFYVDGVSFFLQVIIEFMWLLVYPGYYTVIGDASHSRYQDGLSLWRLLYQTNTQVGRGIRSIIIIVWTS